MQDILVSPILLLIIAALSVLLFIILLFRHKNVGKMNADLKEQNKRLKAIGNIYYSMHIVNLHEDTIQEVSAPEPIRKYAVLNGITPGASDVLKYAISKLIVKDQVKRALEFTDLTTLVGRMNTVDTLADEFKTNEAGWLRFRFMVTDRDAKGLTSDVIMVTAVVDKEKTKEEGLIKISLTDELTGAGNRRAYEEKIAELEKDIPANLVIASLDLNGLKVVNDNKGHDAGDEMIVGAVDCIKKVFSHYGNVYRTGGDEFAAIIRCNDKQLESIKESLEQTVAAWTGKLVESISLSTGYVVRSEMPDASVHEMIVRADQYMNKSKGEYYRHKGVDRRGQKDAHTALCQLYTKILKINITDDTYQIVNMEDEEKTVERGFSDSISGWLEGFARAGQVHPDYVEDYLKKTDIDNLRKHFASGKTSWMIFYKRKIGDNYRHVMMEIITANDYSDDNQNLYLYVKNIEKNS